MAFSPPAGTHAYGTDAAGISDPRAGARPTVPPHGTRHHRRMPLACATDTTSAAPPALLYRASLAFAQRLEPFRDGSGFALSSALSDRRVWVNCRLLAWALLPDGWQGLVQAGALESPELRLKRVREAGERAWAALGRAGSPWAAGGSILPAEATRDPRALARELVAGPVRAGLATRLGDYPFWDATWLDDPHVGGGVGRTPPPAALA